MASWVAQWKRICLPVQELQIWSLGWKDLLEKEMATHSYVLAWKIPWIGWAWWATVHGVTRIKHDLANKQQRQYVRLCCVLSHSVVSDSLRPHGPQHTRPLCPSPTPGACSNSCPLSWWHYPTISSSVPFSRLQSFPASGAFQMSQLFASGGQSTGVSASTSVLPVNTQDWSPLGWTGWISFHFHQTNFK